MTLRSENLPEYAALTNAIHRCHNPNHIAYKRYGARGIKVCEEWRDRETGFKAFLGHIGPRPGSNYSLDRIDNNGHYEPGNVRWADRKTQQNNMRRKAQYVSDFGWGTALSKGGIGRGKGGRWSAVVPFEGRTQTVVDWAKELGLKPATIRQRLERGLSPELAFSSAKRIDNPELSGEKPYPAPHMDDENAKLAHKLTQAIDSINKAIDQLGRTLH